MSITSDAALRRIRDLFIDPDTGQQSDEWDSAADFMEATAEVLKEAGIWFDEANNPTNNPTEESS